MNLTSATTKARKKADLLIVPFWQGGKKGPSPASDLKVNVSPAIDFSGKKDEIVYLYTPKGPEPRVLLLGLGEEKEFTPEKARKAYASALCWGLGKKIKSVNIALPPEEYAKAALEGVLLANYSYEAHRKEPQIKPVEKICLIGELKTAKETAEIVECVNYARDLVFGNADDVTPSLLAKKAQELAKEYTSIHTKVLNREQILKEKMDLLAAVSRGATTPPAFIIAEYRGAPGNKDVTAIIGKGITFDTGGLLLKPRGGMETMRDDMAGGAVVLGVLRAAAKLKLKGNIIGFIPTTENAIGPDSYKPGDVYQSHAGVSVEIADTDAEGRLVLADAISYAQKHYSLKRIIDLATLTGGATVALGEEAAVICSNSDKLSQELIAAGETSYERLWRLPLFEEYKSLLESKIADIKNAGPRKASSICGGIFLQRFVKKEIDWAHIDIAAVAFPDVLKPYQPIQATGFGVRLLVEYFQHLFK